MSPKAPLRDIRLQNVGDLEPFKVTQVKSNGAVKLPLYDFLLVSNSNYMSNAHRLVVTATRKIFSYLLSLGPNFDPAPRPTLTPGQFFFQNLIISSLGYREGSHQK